MLLSIKRPIFVAIGSLCLKAFSARAAALTKENRNLSDTPEYITTLREQRDAAKTRVQAVMARSQAGKTLGSEQALATSDIDTNWPDPNLKFADAQVIAIPPQSPVAHHPASFVQGSTRTGDDAFWLSDALDNDFLPGGAAAADIMNLDTETILAQDYWPDTANGEVIDWTQWDSWLGNLDPIRPNIGAGPG